MAVFTASQRARIQSLVEYLAYNHDLPIDAAVVEQLDRVFGGTSGFPCACGIRGNSIRDSFRDEPIRTFLRLLLAVSDNATGGSLAPTPPGILEVLAGPESPAFFGAAGTFGVLGAETVTNTGPTTISCDLGVYPGGSVTGFPPGVVVGETHVADEAAQDAKNDAQAAYLYLQGLPGGTPVAGDIGGTTFLPGTYKSASSLEITSADVTLDAGGDVDAVFIFQVASALTVTSGRQIILAGGAQANNVYWQVGSSATLGTTVVFNGNILALASITAETGATVDGRLLALNGAVTLDSNVVTCPV